LLDSSRKSSVGLDWWTAQAHKPTARAKAGEAVRLIEEVKSVSEVAEALGIGCASVYRALEDASLKGAY
jgi:DNA invertase Pin-like site-specific DNA recombinase